MENVLGPQSIGVVAGLLIILASGARGMWLFRFQADQQLAEKDKIIALLQDQLVEQRKGSAERLSEERADKLEWKQIALELSDIGKRTVDIAEKSVK